MSTKKKPVSRTSKQRRQGDDKKLSGRKSSGKPGGKPAGQRPPKKGGSPGGSGARKRPQRGSSEGTATTKTAAAEKAPQQPAAAPKAGKPVRRRPPQQKRSPGTPLDLTSAPALGRPPTRKKNRTPAPVEQDKTPAPEHTAEAPSSNTSMSSNDRLTPDSAASEPPLAQDTSGGVAETPEGAVPNASDIQAEPADAFMDDVGMLGIGSQVFPPDMDFQLFSEDGDSDGTADVSGETYADDPSVEARIREIEARLDGLMDTPSTTLEDAPPPRPSAPPKAKADEAVDAARELLESDYYRRQWGRQSLRERSQEVDDFGLDPAFEKKIRPLLDILYKRYFRVQVEGIENVPDTGRAVVVSNHSGALPFDGVVLREALRREHSSARDLRWLAEDFSFYLPFIGVAMNRIGAVRACQENAERLLSRDHLVGVFPEGAEGTKKLYKDRYQLQRFGRGGFVRLCLRTRSPIIPCAIVGAEEAYPIIYRLDNLAKMIGLDYLPITPTFPALGPLGLLPAPTRWRIAFGKPISLDDYGPEAAADHVLVGRISDRVKSSITELLDSGLRRRKSVWL